MHDTHCSRGIMLPPANHLLLYNRNYPCLEAGNLSRLFTLDPMNCLKDPPISQSMLTDTEAHVYCPYKSIRINDEPEVECPNYPFALKLTDQWEIEKGSGFITRKVNHVSS